MNKFDTQIEIVNILLDVNSSNVLLREFENDATTPVDVVTKFNLIQYHTVLRLYDELVKDPNPEIRPYNLTDSDKFIWMAQHSNILSVLREFGNTLSPEDVRDMQLNSNAAIEFIRPKLHVNYQ